MGKDPAFLFYPGDWLGGTMGMTLEEKGAYIELLVLQFNRGHMTTHMIGHVVGHLWDNLKDKFEQDDQGKWFNRRLDEEKEKRVNYSESRRNNLLGINQYTKKKKKKKSGHMTSHMENENENEVDIKEEFEKFWMTYDKKVDRSSTYQRWRKLKNKDKEEIFNHLPKYVSAVEKRFRKDPIRYLSKEVWKDEIIGSNNHQKEESNVLPPSKLPQG